MTRRNFYHKAESRRRLADALTPGTGDEPPPLDGFDQGVARALANRGIVEVPGSTPTDDRTWSRRWVDHMQAEKAAAEWHTKQREAKPAPASTADLIRQAITEQSRHIEDPLPLNGDRLLGHLQNLLRRDSPPSTGAQER